MSKQAIIYCRFSPRPKQKGGEDKECMSNDVQETYCREYCTKQGYDVAGVYQDEYKSGSDPDRTGLWDAVNSLKRGGVLVVYRRDRLARDVYLNECILRAVEARGGSIEAVSGDVQGELSPEITMIRQILASLAEYQRKVTAIRTKHAMLKYQKEGRIMSKCLPYGWKQDLNDPKRMILDAIEQAAIAEACKLAGAGQGCRAIARELAARGFSPRGGGAWSHKTVARMVKRIR